MDAGRGDAVSGIKRADSASVSGNMLRQRVADRNRSGRLRQAHVGQAFANLVSAADGRTALGSCRRLTHRRASLACEAPIARPWISQSGREPNRQVEAQQPATLTARHHWTGEGRHDAACAR